MAASNTSGPDESGGLSPREQKVLAEIEYDLFVADPTLARHLECADWPPAGIRLWAAVRHVGLLITMLINRQLGIRGAGITDPTHLAEAPPD